MRTKYMKVLLVLILFSMCLTVLAPEVYAQEAQDIVLPVKVFLDGSPPNIEDYEVIMEADNLNYPMPLGSQDGIYRLIISEEGMVVLPGMMFTDLGIYTYTIYQEPGENQLIDYDERVYNLVIYVTNSPSGQGLDTMVILYLLGEPTKQEEIVLDNEYTEEPEEPEEPEETAPGPRPEEPGKPEGPSRTTKVDSVSQETTVPQTGDDTVIWPYVGLLLSGAGILLMAGFTVNKKKSDND